MALPIPRAYLRLYSPLLSGAHTATLSFCKFLEFLQALPCLRAFASAVLVEQNAHSSTCSSCQNLITPLFWAEIILSQERPFRTPKINQVTSYSLPSSYAFSIIGLIMICKRVCFEHHFPTRQSFTRSVFVHSLYPCFSMVPGTWDIVINICQIGAKAFWKDFLEI